MSGRAPRGGGRGRGGPSQPGESQSLPFHPSNPGRGGGPSRGRGDGSGRGRGDGSGRGRGDSFARGRGDGALRGRGRGGPRGGGEVQVFNPGYPAIKNESIQESEDSILSKLKRSIDADLPQRPGYGTRGRPVLLWANYFELQMQSDVSLHRYDVKVSPSQGKRAIPNKKIKRIIQLAIEEHLSPGGHDVVSDFRSTIISRRQIQLPGNGYTVQYRAEQEDDAAQDAESYKVQMQHTGVLALSTLLDFTASASTSSLFGDKQELIQALNIVVGQHPKTQPTVVTVGKNRHTSTTLGAEDRMSLGAGLEALRAFVFSVRAATERLLVNVHIKNLPFYEAGPLEQLAHAFSSSNGPNRYALQAFLKRVSIEVMHIRRTNKAGGVVPRYKTIIGLASRSDGKKLPHPPQVPSHGAGAKAVKFYLQDDAPSSSTAGPSQPTGGKGKKKAPKGESAGASGRYISVFDFFKERYNITIKDAEMPVINVGTPENPSYLPMQVCQVRAGQPAPGQISPRQTESMIRFAVRRPAQNAQSISTLGLPMLGLEGPNPTLNAFGISVNARMITVPGRVMPPPAINYASGQQMRPSFGNWNMTRNRLVRGAALTNWTYLHISAAGKRQAWPSPAEFHACLDAFTAKLNEIGMRVGPYRPGMMLSVNPGDLEPRIDEALHKFASNQNPPSLVFVILPSTDTTAVYNRVKYACDVKEGLINQCVVDRKFANGNDQYFANVGLKVNLKLGGCNHAVPPAELGIIDAKTTMFIGLDVTHPSPGSRQTAPSVAGIVSSIDEQLAQWPADIRVQTARQEMVSSVGELTKGCLRRWQQRNRTLPRNIILYRDGVSEGQYQLVREHEIPAIKSAFREVYPPNDTSSGLPHLSVVVVGKRHHTRFYATTASDADRSGNPTNGTVVDRGVTEAANWDFFLQAHAAIQGTARPGHYYVVHDEVFRRERLRPPLVNPADALEQLSHALCYLFGRATKAVSICPPAYYADLVCERARCYLAPMFAPTPTGSSAPSVVEGGGDGDGGGEQGEGEGEGEGEALDGGAVRLHERVRNAMFYI